LFDRDTEQAATVSARVLREILREHQDSEYGLRYDFRSIERVEDYTSRVPLITYAEIEELVSRMAKGEKNVLSSAEVDHFMLTSGTSRAPKLIPTNRIERKRRIPFYAFLPQGTLARALGTDVLFGRGMNGMSIASNDRQTEAGTRISSSLRIGLAEHTWLMQRLWVSPVAVYQVADVEAAYYLHWLFALADRDLVYVSDEFASKMTYALNVLLSEWPSLVEDLRSGRLRDDLKLEPQLRREIEAHLQRNPRRAAEVQAAFQATPDGEGLLPRLWPKLRYVACIYTGTFQVYEDRVRRFAGHLPVFNVAYGSSEACIATALGPNDPRYVVYPRAGFLEFIRERDIPKPNPRTYLLDELEVGESYEIVATNFAGLYRYRTADVVRVVDFCRSAPVIEFQYRANVLMNLNAEMMTENAAYEALRRAAQRVPCQLVDHTIRPDTEVFPPRYAFYVEVDGSLDPVSHDALDAALDSELRNVNPRYEDRIDRGRLQRSVLKLVDPGAFQSLQLRIAEDAREHGISAVQTKVPRLLTHGPYVKLLETRARMPTGRPPCAQIDRASA
jgi:hypothetical protein